METGRVYLSGSTLGQRGCVQRRDNCESEDEDEENRKNQYISDLSCGDGGCDQYCGRPDCAYAAPSGLSGQYRDDSDRGCAGTLVWDAPQSAQRYFYGGDGGYLLSVFCPGRDDYGNNERYSAARRAGRETGEERLDLPEGTGGICTGNGYERGNQCGPLRRRDIFRLDGDRTAACPDAPGACREYFRRAVSDGLYRPLYFDFCGERGPSAGFRRTAPKDEGREIGKWKDTV